MTKKSAGILLYRILNNYLELFLVHPGGPFYVNKDLGVWSIPKGEFENEEPVDAALREFYEETGMQLEANLIYLDEIKMKSGKIIYCWAAEKNFDPSVMKSNLFELEWPPKSGKMQTFPEMDKGEWFTVGIAKEKIHSSQIPFVERLLNTLNLSTEKIYPILNKKGVDKGNEGQLSLFL